MERKPCITACPACAAWSSGAELETGTERTTARGNVAVLHRTIGASRQGRPCLVAARVSRGPEIRLDAIVGAVPVDESPHALLDRGHRPEPCVSRQVGDVRRRCDDVTGL